MASHRARLPGPRRSVRRGTRSHGQSLVEFALVAPILVILLAAVADFGRIFAVNLALEAAARDGAEVASNEYLANPPGATATPPVLLSDPAPAGSATYYGPLHQRIARVVCAETSDLPNTNFDPSTGDCAGMPLIVSCVHDSQDTNCGTEAYGQAIPADCPGLTTPALNNAQQLGPSGELPRYVEVRICYRFTAILNLPAMPFSEVWLQRSKKFTIPCYFALGTQECG